MKFGLVPAIRLLKLMPGKVPNERLKYLLTSLKEYHETVSFDFSVYIIGLNAY